MEQLFFNFSNILHSDDHIRFINYLSLPPRTKTNFIIVHGLPSEQVSYAGVIQTPIYTYFDSITKFYYEYVVLNKGIKKHTIIPRD